MEDTTFFPVTSQSDRIARETGETIRTTPTPPSRWAYNATLLLLGLGLGVFVALPIVDGTQSELHVTGGLAMFVGSVTGLVGTYLALLMVILASRMPALERVLGQGGVIHWHRKLAPWPILLILAHAIFLTLSYAEAAKTGVLSEVGVVVNTFPHLLSATIGLGIMVLIGIISVPQIRRNISRENWWILHLLMYVALAISFAHELALGPSFVKHPLTQIVWIGGWLIAVALIVIFRIGVPIYRTVRHQLRVAEVHRESEGVVSIVLQGKDLDRLQISGGQFFEWRFLTKGMWWQAHPFTVSAMPKPPYMRLTVKALGDFSSSLSEIKVGTAVAIEGPYGSFTVGASKRPQALLIAGGIGVTAVRALLEEIPLKSRPVVVLRANKESELALVEEITELVKHRKGVVHKLIGKREAVNMAAIVKLVPDMKRRDVFICGPEGFVNQVESIVKRNGVPPEAIHHEAYSI
ncbi:ferredoxin reductase family protein [Acidithrix ferrooxidans]|uniref:Flavohemoprotein n=1 Tax=Acidithrix ferrooxidans TaxID=1280514 RepID=A0A0D8HHP6_9ACTN|nr:ferredoxin reductase family protein [Acidithrix ferrooxidans]KJF17312.1 flavohemoprotein [Acidithrix ferrooxidans]